jgi:hypothetical protein
MIQGIDHLVVVVKNLDQAAKDYQQLGFNVVPGGQHPVGSHNVLISFQDGSYIEIIASIAKPSITTGIPEQRALRRLLLPDR